MPTARPDSYPGVPGTTLYAGIAPPDAGGVEIGGFSLVNTSGSTQAANFVSPMMGVQMAQGDVPAGQYPHFRLADDTPCPATLWGYTFWPDGSMAFCGAMLQVPSSIAGSGSLPITLFNGGTAPAASGRTTADLLSADLKIEFTGVTNLSGTWVSSLNDGISVADDIRLIGNGPAGAIWCVGAEFRQGGSAHGQLYGRHYVAALNTAGGALRGLRYMGEASQPWVDVTSPPAAVRVGVGVFKSGATTVRTLQGTNSSEAGVTNITMAHYSGWHTCGANGKADYIQGGGTDAADCTVRVVFNKSNFIATKLVPPYQTGLTPTAPAAPSYRTYCIGSMTARNTGGTGERDEIGVLPEWQVRHLLNQHANDEQAVRVTSLAARGWRTHLRRRSTGRILPTVNKVSSYPVLGTTAPTVRFFGGGADGGINAPSGNTSNWIDEDQTHHRASTSYYAYLITGEPWHKDIMLDAAAGAITSRHPNGWTWFTGSPITGQLRGGTQGERDMTVQGGGVYKGGGTFFEEWGVRISAWLARDIGHAAALTPDADPEKAYFMDVINASFDAANDYNNRLPTSWRAGGIWSCEGPDNTIPQPWQTGYLSNAVCHIASILGTSNAAQFRQHLSKGYSAQNDLGRTSAMFGSYRALSRTNNDQRIEGADQYVCWLESGLNFTISGSKFTVQDATGVGAASPNGGWTPHNGDVICFHQENTGATRPFAAGTNGTRLYVVNANTTERSGQLSLTPGGAPIAVTTNVVINDCFGAVADFSPHYAFYGYGDESGYTANAYAAMRHHEACGDTNIAAARADADEMWSRTGSAFGAEVKNAMAPAYPI